MPLSWLEAPARALVVGINEYDNKAITTLHGCVADARAVVAFLREELGMPAERIRLLSSPATGPDERRATRAEIVAGFEEFLGETPAGEEALFYFSGHGSTSALEPEIAFGDKRGETLVPADARANGVLELLDRELRYLVAELVDKGIRLTLVTDACHAGDVFRGDSTVPPAEPVPRLADASGTVRTFASLLGGTADRERLEALFSGRALPYTQIAGCLATQQSFEEPQPGGEIRGAMTVALLRFLRDAGGPLSYRELGRAIRSAIPRKNQRMKQYPHVVGEVDRRLFSGDSVERAAPLFAVQAITPEGGIELDGGGIEGVDVGAELGCFADWTLQQPQGRWRVTTSRPDRATAEPLDGAARPAVGQPLRLESSLSRPTLFFAPDAHPVEAAWRDRELKGPAFLRQHYQRPADYNVRAEGGFWVVERADGSMVERLRSPQSQVARFSLAFALDRVACYEHFVAQEAGEGERLGLAAGGVGLEVHPLDWQGQKGRPLAAGGAPLPKGARFLITLTNLSNLSLFAKLYRLDDANQVAGRVWPADGAQELQPGQARDGLWEDRHWPGGLLQLKLFVSTDPLEIPTWPCGQGGAHRGASMAAVRPVQERDARWAVREVTLGGS